MQAAAASSSNRKKHSQKRMCSAATREIREADPRGVRKADNGVAPHAPPVSGPKTHLSVVFWLDPAIAQITQNPKLKQVKTKELKTN